MWNDCPGDQGPSGNMNNVKFIPPWIPLKTHYNIILSERFCQFFLGSPESYTESEDCSDLYRGRYQEGRGMQEETTGNRDPPQMEMCANVALDFRK